MKITCLYSTLSCSKKCIRFFAAMINKKLIFRLLALSLLTGCTSPTAMLGPMYTLSSTGNVFQAGLSYGTNEAISTYTGKTPMENLKEISLDKKYNTQNIHKKTLESEDFYILVKNKIDKTGGILKLSNQ